MVPADKTDNKSEKIPIPDPIGTLVTPVPSITGSELLAEYTIPRSLTVPPPLLVILPPSNAAEVVTPVGVVVVKVGAAALTDEILILLTRTPKSATSEKTSKASISAKSGLDVRSID